MLAQDPNKTETIYTLIREEKYNEVVTILESELPSHPQNRCILSLLAYCYYYLQDFHSASNYYEKLTKYYPEIEEYRVYYCQSLWKASLYEEALRGSTNINNFTQIENIQAITHMRACIKYEQNNLIESSNILESMTKSVDSQNKGLSKSNVYVLVGQACIDFKDEKYKDALKKYQDALNIVGFRPDLAYNIALCHFRLKNFNEMDKIVDNIIAKGANANPNLSVGSAAGGLQVQSVGITHALKETALIEAFNLKIAKEFECKNMEGAKQALWGMPPRDESEYDSVTLHNSAILDMVSENSSKINEAFRKLNFLLTQESFPDETFQNLLLSYIQHGLYNMCADVLAENQNLHELYLDPELYELIDAILLANSSSSPSSQSNANNDINNNNNNTSNLNNNNNNSDKIAKSEAYHKFDILCNKKIEVLRNLTKKLNEAKENNERELMKEFVSEYLETLEKYIQVLMQKAHIYWQMENYPMIENIFEKSKEFADNHDIWKLNLAHTLFMQENKFTQAVTLYEPIVRKAMTKDGNSNNNNNIHSSSILSVKAMVLANLCVAYIMTSQNEAAEELMRQIEKEEERMLYLNSKKQGIINNSNDISEDDLNAMMVSSTTGGAANNGGTNTKMDKNNNNNNNNNKEDGENETKEQYYHLCIVNLVIGTLYCSKGNYTFGLQRIIKSLEPLSNKLSCDTWYHCKRCFLSYLEMLSKQIFVIKDGKYDEILLFLDQVIEYGKNINANITYSANSNDNTTVAQEARHLKMLYLKLLQ